MTRDSTSYFLRDIADLIARAAVDARGARDRADSETDRLFQNGRLIAYHEVVSLMQQQAISFGIELSSSALTELRPEHDLL